MDVRWQLKELSSSGYFLGYASVFATRDDHNEIVERGAFKKTLQRWQQRASAPAMLWMHDPSRPIGRWRTLAEDEVGLHAEGQLALRTCQGMEAYELLKLGAINGLSIGYRVVGSRYDAVRRARILSDVDLIEISLVTFPANPAARVRAVKEGQSRGAVLHAGIRALHRAACALSSSTRRTHVWYE